MRPKMLSLLVLLSLSGPALGIQKPEFEISDYNPKEHEFLVEGSEARLRLVVAGEMKLRAVYRPDSEVEDFDELTADSDGWIRWTPRFAGLVLLEAYRVEGVEDKQKIVVASRVVSVSFASGFTIGIVIMIVAGLLLFGGAFLSIRALLRP
ncbi:MAG: hypothetical protein ACE5F1_22305 [Planctomycetota bacterium]